MAPLGAHSALEPAGVQARHSLQLFDAYLYVAVLVFFLVIAALGFALGKRSDPAHEKREPPIEAKRGKRGVVAWATIATVFTLIGLLIASVSTGHSMALMPSAEPVEVEVVGHKWWWEFRYPVGGVATRFSTAYELHVPVGRPVKLKLMAIDVIHSFWVPSLSGKLDAIPGKDRTLLLRADRAGSYEGQCAEFCGAEHANMRFLVVAESAAKFAAWRDHQLGSPAPPTDALRQRGLEVFMSSRCSTCHAIGGTDAFGTVGPNLTHVASRRRLAMGTLENTPEHLSSWISDPQTAKPGVQMPSTPLPAEDRRALLAYLEGLQ
jgi:cytochrome c oxidase subunit 2